MFKTFESIGIKIIASLGEGAVTRIYRVRSEERDGDSVLKILLSDFLENEVYFQRFQQEQEILEKLDHPNIVKLYGCGVADKHPYIEMEYFEKGSLRGLLKGTPLSWVDARKMIKDILKALIWAHQQSIIHRDLKPENLFYCSQSGNVKVGDFGLAYLLDQKKELTQVGQLIGSPPYLSPEQAKGEVVSTSCDIYSLGVIVFEMLTGTLPFQSDNLSGYLYHHIHTEPKWKEEIEVSPAVRNWVMKALNKAPKKRFLSAQEMLDALPDEEGKLKSPSSKIGLSKGVLLLILLSLVGALYFWGSQDKKGLPKESEEAEKLEAKEDRQLEPFKGVYFEPFQPEALTPYDWVIWDSNSDHIPDLLQSHVFEGQTIKGDGELIKETGSNVILLPVINGLPNHYIDPFITFLDRLYKETSISVFISIPIEKKGNWGIYSGEERYNDLKSIQKKLMPLFERLEEHPAFRGWIIETPKLVNEVKSWLHMVNRVQTLSQLLKQKFPSKWIGIKDELDHFDDIEGKAHFWESFDFFVPHLHGQSVDLFTHLYSIGFLDVPLLVYLESSGSWNGLKGRENEEEQGLELKKACQVIGNWRALGQGSFMGVILHEWRDHWARDGKPNEQSLGLWMDPKRAGQMDHLEWKGLTKLKKVNESYVSLPKKAYEVFKEDFHWWDPGE